MYAGQRRQRLSAPGRHVAEVRQRRLVEHRPAADAARPADARPTDRPADRSPEHDGSRHAWINSIAMPPRAAKARSEPATTATTERQRRRSSPGSYRAAAAEAAAGRAGAAAEGVRQRPRREGPVMRWKVGIEGPPRIVHLLSIVISDHDIRLVAGRSVSVLHGSRLDSLDDAGSVRCQAERIVTILSGSARILLGSTESLHVMDVTESGADASEDPGTHLPHDPGHRGRGGRTASGRSGDLGTWSQSSLFKSRAPGVVRSSHGKGTPAAGRRQSRLA